MLTITDISVITVHMKVNGQPTSHFIKQDVRLLPNFKRNAYYQTSSYCDEN